MSKANNVMAKLANADKIKKLMAQGLSYDEAAQKAYPEQGPKDKGVTDPARPEMPKEAFFGAAAKALTGAGRVAAKVSKATSKATGKATRNLASKAGKELLRHGSKNKRVVTLPDGKLWHPNKAALAATKGTPAGGKLTNLIRKYPKTAVGVGALAGGKIIGDMKYDTGVHDALEAAKAVDSYQIQRGDNLSGIANRYGVTPSQIQEANQIPDADYIRAGETLRVPTNIIPPKLSPGVQEPQNPTNPALKAIGQGIKFKKEGSLSKEAFIGSFTKGLGYGAKYLKGLKGLQAAGKAVAKKADDIAPKLIDKQKGGGKYLPDGRISPDAIKAHNKAVAESGKFPNKHIKGVGDVGKPKPSKGKQYGHHGQPGSYADDALGEPMSGPYTHLGGSNQQVTKSPQHPLKELYKKWGLD